MLAAATGCSTLPDVQPFTDATVRLRSAVASSGAATLAEMRRSGLEGIEEQAAELERAWQERQKLFSSLVEYANSLQGIVDAGKAGAESAKAVADSVQKLAQSANLVQPGTGPAAAAVTEAAQFVYQQIAIARAARSLEKSLAAIDPAAARIAEQIAADIADLEAIFLVTSQKQNNVIQEKFGPDTNLRDELERARIRRQEAMRTSLRAGKAPSELADATELSRADELLAGLAPKLDEMNGQLGAISERERVALQLFAEIRSGLADWAAAHTRILTAVRTKRIPSAAELGAAADRIRQLVEKFENL